MPFFTYQKILLSAESHINFRMQCIIMTQKRGPPSHMHHSQSFDKIDTFLKPVLNILILCNLFLG